MILRSIFSCTDLLDHNSKYDNSAGNDVLHKAWHLQNGQAVGTNTIGSSEACMLGGVAAWLRWREKRKAQGKPYDKPNFVISSGFSIFATFAKNRTEAEFLTPLIMP